MSKASTIQTLPEDVLEQLQTLLRDPRVSQLQATKQINAILESQGEDIVSKSAVNRYALKMEQIGAKLRQSREISEMWIANLGSQPQGKLGKLINEMIRTMAFETAASMAEGEEPVPPKAIKDLALAVQRLESAANMNEERERKIRSEAVADAADTAEKTLKQNGLSAKAITQIKNDILGIIT